MTEEGQWTENVAFFLHVNMSYLIFNTVIYVGCVWVKCVQGVCVWGVCQASGGGWSSILAAVNVAGRVRERVKLLGQLEHNAMLYVEVDIKGWLTKTQQYLFSLENTLIKTDLNVIFHLKQTLKWKHD